MISDMPFECTISLKFSPEEERLVINNNNPFQREKLNLSKYSER